MLVNNQSPNSNGSTWLTMALKRSRSAKRQTNHNHQIPMVRLGSPWHSSEVEVPITKLIKFGKLVIGYWLLFGYWCLVIGVCEAFALNLDKLKSHFLQGDYALAISEGERLLASASAHEPELDLLYYFLGLSYLKVENYLRASDIFEIILEEFPDTRLREEVRLSLGDSYFLRGDFTRARAYYREALNKNANNKYKALLYYRLSQTGFKEGDTQSAKEYLDKLKSEFPQGFESIIKEDICSLPDVKAGVYYSVQVGSFSKSLNARNLTQKLIKEGYSAYTEETFVSDGAKTYRVRVGKLTLLEEAKQLARELTQKGYPTKIRP
jgi:tetratricopeptide (TPR) repeat protein